MGLALFQDRARDRSSQVLPRLDDGSRRRVAMDRGHLRDSDSADCHHQGGQWTMLENGLLAQHRNGKGNTN